MKIINIPLFQLVFFKVNETLHVTVSNLDDSKVINRNQLHTEQFNKACSNVFESIFNRPITDSEFKTAPSLFDSTTQVLIIILK